MFLDSDAGLVEGLALWCWSGRGPDPVVLVWSRAWPCGAGLVQGLALCYKSSHHLMTRIKEEHVIILWLITVQSFPEVDQ